MQTLNTFQAPNDGDITLCEVDGRVHSMNYEYANTSAYTTTIENHPKVHITRELLHSHCSSDEKRPIFVSVDEPLLKRLLQIYYELGFLEVLNTIGQRGPFLLRKSALIFMNVIQGFNLLKSKIISNDSDNITKINSISLTKSWCNSLIRYIAWHPYLTKIAVASIDDSVRIYSGDSHLVPLLKYKQQTNITCLAWRPLSFSEIAVGCENGIFVWNVDPNSLVTRPSVNNAIILYRINHKPIISLAWSVRGDLLASAAACDSTILVWNVELDETSSLKRPGGSGNVFLKWSPTGNKLFSATMNIIFRMWDCQNWQAERWNLLSGRVQAACWSPCGGVLIFATTEEPTIYALSCVPSDAVFTADLKNLPNQAIPIYDLTKVDIDGLIVGGLVQNMEWDPKGEHLAIVFKDTNYVAIFKVSLQPSLQLNPGCLVAGMPEEKPTNIAFQLNFQYGACLSIGWSRGRLQHFPIVYSEQSTSLNNRNSNNSSLFRSMNMYKSPSRSFQ